MGNYKYDSRRPVEDSTKGASKHMPKTYKGDVMAQVWLESRKLATLCKWLDKIGVSTRFLSEVVRETLDMVVDHLIETGTVEMVEFTEDARDMLQRRYRVKLNVTDGDGILRGGKNIHHNLHLDHARKKKVVGEYSSNSNSNVPEFSSETKSSRPIDNVTAEQVAEKMKEIENKEFYEDIEKQKKDIKEKCKFDESGVIANMPRVIANVGEEEMKKFKEEEEERTKVEERERKELKESKKKDRRMDTLQKQIDKAKEEMSELKPETEPCVVGKGSSEIKIRPYDEILADRVKKDAVINNPD